MATAEATAVETPLADEPLTNGQPHDEQAAEPTAQGAAEPATEQPAATEPESGEVSTYTRIEQQHYQQIVDMQREVHRKRSEYLDAKEEAKARKGVFEAALSELQLLIEGGPDAQLKLPGMTAAGTQAMADAVATKPRIEAWRSATLGDLGFSGQIEKLLAEAGLATLGAISDFTAGGNELTSIKGIGPGKAESISERLEIYWREHPEYCGNQETDEASESLENATSATDFDDDEFAEGDEFAEPDGDQA